MPSDLPLTFVVLLILLFSFFAQTGKSPLTLELSEHGIRSQENS